MNKETTQAEKIGDWIKTKRQERGLSLRALAEKAGISHTSLDKIERGGGIRDATLRLVIVAIAGDGASCEDTEALHEEARAIRAGMPVTTPQDAALLAKWRELSPESQALISALLEQLASRPA